MRYFLVFIVIFLLSACSTTRSLEMSPEQIQTSVNAGELNLVNKNLILTLKDGTRKEGTVSEVTDNSIIFDDDDEFLFSNIIAIEYNQDNGLKTFGKVIGGTLLVGLVVVLVIVDKHN